MRVRLMRVVTTRTLIIATGLLVAALTLVRMAVFWPRHTYLDMVAGVWTAIAYDLANGVFYRAPVGPDGYGGTRYFPLFFVGHAALIRLGVDPVWAGHFMSAASVGVMVAAIAWVLRRHGAGPAVAGAAACLVLSPKVMQGSLLGIHADALAAGLSLVGLAMVTRPGRRALVLAFVCFALSVMTKVTSMAGAATAVVWLMLRHRRRDALEGATVFGVLVVVLTAATWWWSDGRFADAFAVAADRPPISAFVLAPFTMLRYARNVPDTALFLQTAAAVWLLSAARGRLGELPWLYWTFAMLGAIPIFAMPGTNINHLVEPAAASVLLLSWQALQRPERVTLATTLLVTAALAATSALAWGLVRRDAEQRWGTPAETLALIPDRSRPILSENAAIPVEAGQRPYMLDAYMFQLIASATPAFTRDFRDRIRRQAFAAVVLDRDPHSDKGRNAYRVGFFGPGFIELMEQHYRPAGMSRSRIVYLPRGDDGEQAGGTAAPSAIGPHGARGPE